MSELDWSDLRYVLAVSQTGSLASAARQLSVNHTTVLRRLDALEVQLGVRLFERLRSGYLPTEAGALVLEQARRMADHAAEIERQVAGRDRQLSGLLRLTTADVLMAHLLAAPLADFAREFPAIEVEVVEHGFLPDLSRRHADEPALRIRREADVAIRLTNQVADHLVGRPLGQTQCRVYALRGATGLPQSVRPLAELLRDVPWIALERDSNARVYDHWMRKHLAQAQVRLRVDLFNAAAAVLRTGLAVAVLPTFVAASHPELVAVSDEIAELAVPVWILTHPDLRHAARVRAFMQLVGDRVAERLGSPSAHAAAGMPPDTVAGIGGGS